MMRRPTVAGAVPGGKRRAVYEAEGGAMLLRYLRTTRDIATDWRVSPYLSTSLTCPSATTF